MCHCGTFTQQLHCKIQVRAFQGKFHNSIYEARCTVRDLMLTTEFKQFNATRTNFLLSYAMLPVIQYTLLYFKVKTDDPDTSYKPSRDAFCLRRSCRPPQPSPTLLSPLKGTEKAELEETCNFQKQSKTPPRFWRPCKERREEGDRH